MIYILSCEDIKNGGGIYSFDLLDDGVLKKKNYYPCSRPMYAIKCEAGLCVLLRQPFDDNENSGYFLIDYDLQEVTKIKDTKGMCACHLTVHGNDVYVVNYLSGNIVKNGKNIEQRKGNSVHPIRQKAPHTHFVDKTFDGYFAVCDLGTDTLAVYDQELNIISESKVPLGSGIRHLVFSNNGKYIYAVNELIPSVSVFGYEKGKTKYINTVKIPCVNPKANGAAIRIANNGKFLYVSLREENVICVFEIFNERLKLLQTTYCGGDSPRDIILNKNFLFCSNEKSGNVSVFLLKNGLIEKLVSNCNIKNALCCLF